MTRWTLPALFLIVFAFAGCDNPQRTVDSLRAEIADFKATPDATKQIQIDANFAKLQNQIVKLEGKDSTKADALKRQYAGLQGEYQAAKLSKTLNDAKNAIEGFGEAFKEGAKSLGETFRGSETNSSE